MKLAFTVKFYIDVELAGAEPATEQPQPWKPADAKLHQFGTLVGEDPQDLTKPCFTPITAEVVAHMQAQGVDVAGIDPLPEGIV